MGKKVITILVVLLELLSCTKESTDYQITIAGTFGDFAPQEYILVASIAGGQGRVRVVSGASSGDFALSNLQVDDLSGIVHSIDWEKLDKRQGTHWSTADFVGTLVYSVPSGNVRQQVSIEVGKIEDSPVYPLLSALSRLVGPEFGNVLVGVGM